jgi:hypothetical protein
MTRNHPCPELILVVVVTTVGTPDPGEEFRHLDRTA